ncbi:MAG: GAK system XXXCH domain-containing protein [Desulfobulbaceae bacterium]|nr:GAK system XXXCH domain-containing protein [Desulfobulbaceae bacterium]
MANRSVKFEKNLSAQQAAAFLRDLADKIESGLVDQMEEVDLQFDDFKKMKIGIKRVDDLIEIKAKVKYSSLHHVAENPAESQPSALEEKVEPPAYSILKKRMQKTFKALGVGLRAGKVPEKSLVDSFAADSELMISYSGYGDEFYEVFLQAVQSFLDACDRGNAPEAAKLYNALKARRKECHGRYK